MAPRTPTEAEFASSLAPPVRNSRLRLDKLDKPRARVHSCLGGRSLLRPVLPAARTGIDALSPGDSSTHPSAVSLEDGARRRLRFGAWLMAFADEGCDVFGVDTTVFRPRHS